MKYNQVKAGALLSYLLLIITNITGIFLTPTLLRELGQSEFGLYSLTSSIVSYLTILDFGIGSAIVRYIAMYRLSEDKDNEYSLNGMFLTINTFIGLIVIFVGGILYSTVDRIFSTTMLPDEMYKMKIMLLLLIINLAITFPLGTFTSIATAYERFVFLKITNILRSLMVPLIMLLLLFMGYKSLSLVLTITIFNIVYLVANMWYCFVKLNTKLKFKNFDFVLLKEIFQYSFWMFLFIIVDKIYWGSNQFILGIVSGSKMVAVYAIALQFVNYYMALSTAISGVFLPRITQMIAQNSSEEEISNVFIRIGRLQYIILSLILSSFILYGKAFIKYWAGIDYSNAYIIALIIMIPLTVPLIQTLSMTILQAKNIMGFRAITYVCIALLSIVVSLYLGKIYGGIGAAIGTTVALVLGNVFVMNIYYYIKLKIDIIGFWRNILKMSVSVFTAMMFGLLLNYFIIDINLIQLFIKIFVYLILFSFLMWTIGMNNYERNLLITPLRSLFQKYKSKKYLSKKL